jgi:hypothetical protein
MDVATLPTPLEQGWACTPELLTSLGHGNDFVGNQPMSLAVHGRSRLGRRCVNQTEERAGGSQNGPATLDLVGRETMVAVRRTRHG